MGLSDKLAKLNFDRFAAFGSQEKKSAVFKLHGDTYQGLDATSLDDPDLESHKRDENSLAYMDF